MRNLFAGLTVWLLVVGAAGQTRAQEPSSGAPALAVPAAGEAVITNMTPTQVHVTWIVVGAHVSARQEISVRVTIPVIGVPLSADMTIPIVTSGTQVYFWGSQNTVGRATNIPFRGPAGNIITSIVVKIPAQGPSYDPARIDIHVLGADGTGMFEGIRMAGVLRGLFRPTGTLYLTFPSSEAALTAIRGGLSQNGSLTDAQRQAYFDQAQQALTQAHMEAFPTDQAVSAQGSSGQSATAGPPAQAQVTSTISQSGGQASVAVRVVVPAGPARQTVRVVAIASDGTVKTITEGAHAPGDIVTATASGTPPFIVQVYVGDTMVKQIEARGQ